MSELERMDKKTIEEKTTEELVLNAKDGNNDAYNELVKRNATKLYHVAYSFLHNKEDAEEVVQDTFVRGHKALQNFRGDSKFETWLYRIVSNLSRNRILWNNRRRIGSNLSLTELNNFADSDDNDFAEYEIPDNRMTPDGILEEKETEDKVLTHFEQLPDKLKEVMLLRHIEDLSHKDIAQFLNCKLGTVKSRISRGREILRGKMK